MHIGLIGLGTMGANLARNASRNGATVTIFNRTTEKTDAFMKAHGSEGQFIPSYTIQELVKSLPLPRVIILMVKADAVYQVIEELTPLLSKEDVIVDAGNSHDVDSMVHGNMLMRNHGIRYIGLGVSGGEEGALHGPSLMPGGSREAYDLLEPLLRAMAADDGEGGKCVSYLGPEGAGHFVKIVHNGIEYGIMQLIAEAYDLLKREGGYTNAQIADFFGAWNRTDTLASFLMEITERILRTKDAESDQDLLDVIKDAAGQKGTGIWTTGSALNYGVAVPTITAAVDARIISSGKEFRTKQSAKSPLVTEEKRTVQNLPEKIQSALACSIINTYAQGFQLLEVGGQAKEITLPIPEIARIWRGGCIIRSALLPYFQKMFSGDEHAAQWIREQCSSDAQLAWRSVVSLGALRGIPLPAMSATLSYYDAYRTERLPQHLIQAQRDFFGSHGFERLDRPGTFHGSWK